MKSTLLILLATVLELVIGAPLAGFYANPVIPDTNCPDPGIVYHAKEHKYYIATTTNYNDVADKFPIHESTNLSHWTLAGHVFPRGKLPVWAEKDFWAPEIHHIAGHYVAYYTARDTTGLLCVGVARGPTPTGPFLDIGEPLVRNVTVGMIDATYFYDKDTAKGYLIWKEDGNGKTPPEKYTPIWAQPLSADGLRLEGTRTMILQNDPNSWEGPLVEGPWVIRKESEYFLFYSANGYASDKYAVGVARSSHILGPYVKYSGNPIIHSNQHWSGPGHCAVHRVANSTKLDDFFVVYHSWLAGKIGNGNPRVLMLDSIEWTTDNWPIIQGKTPSSGSTPIPAK